MKRRNEEPRWRGSQAQIEHRAYRRGIEAVAGYLEMWDPFVAATLWRLSDVVRFKFNLIGRRDMRRAHDTTSTFRTLPNWAQEARHGQGRHTR